MIIISKTKLVGLFIIGLFLSLPLMPMASAFSYSGTNLPSNTIYFDDFGNYPQSTCTTAALGCLPGWGAYDNATGGIANVTKWHPLASSGWSMFMQSGTAAGSKFDRHRSWAITAGQTKVSISQWFQFSQTMHSGGTNSAPSELHFSLEMVGSDGNFHECLIEYFSPGATIQSNDFIGIKDQAFNFNFTMRAFDVGGFNNNPNTLFANFEWHYEKITMDISNPAAPTCPYMQIDNLIISSLPPSSGWSGTPSTPASYPTSSTSHVNTQYTDANGYKYTRPWRLEIAMINNAGVTYQSWHTNVLITDDTPGNPPIIQFGITLLSAWFPILIASIAMLYTTSGIGLIRRVWFNKTEGILSSYRTIVATGMIATIGFIVLLAVGALLTQQVCSSLPQGTATCSY